MLIFCWFSSFSITNLSVIIRSVLSNTNKYIYILAPKIITYVFWYTALPKLDSSSQSDVSSEFGE